MFTPNVHEIPSARTLPREIDPAKVVRPTRLDDETREKLRALIEDGYRFLMCDPSPIL